MKLLVVQFRVGMNVQGYSEQLLAGGIDSLGRSFG